MFVWNSTDTSELEWTVFVSRLKIVSTPVAGLQRRRAHYKYRIDVAGMSPDTLIYGLLNGPSWLELANDGILRGTVADTPGVYDVWITVHDLMGNADTQRFQLTVPSPVVVGQQSVALSDMRMESHPNPFNGTTQIAWMMDSDGYVSMDLYSLSGAHLRSLVDNVFATQGVHEARWDGTDGSGIALQSGTYFIVGTVAQGHERINVGKTLIQLMR